MKRSNGRETNTVRSMSRALMEVAVVAQRLAKAGLLDPSLLDLEVELEVSRSTMRAFGGKPKVYVPEAGQDWWLHLDALGSKHPDVRGLEGVKLSLYSVPDDGEVFDPQSLSELPPREAFTERGLETVTYPTREEQVAELVEWGWLTRDEDGGQLRISRPAPEVLSVSGEDAMEAAA